MVFQKFGYFGNFLFFKSGINVKRDVGLRWLSSYTNKSNFSSGKIWKLARFSASTIILSGLITVYSFVNYGYYLKDSIHWNPNWNSELKCLKGKNNKKEKDCFNNDNERKWHQNILVRHGQYNLSGKEDEEKVLTEIGIEQAEETGKYLFKQYSGKVNAIYHSNMRRAKETAQIISKYFPGVKLIEDPNLAEGVPIAPSPTVSGFNPTKEEIFRDRERIDTAFKTYFVRKSEIVENKVDIIVCHGNVIRYMFCKGLQYPTSGWLRLNHLNCGITRMSVSSDNLVICSGLGDGGHLKPNIHTYN